MNKKRYVLEILIEIDEKFLEEFNILNQVKKLGQIQDQNPFTDVLGVSYREEKND